MKIKIFKEIMIYNLFIEISLLNLMLKEESINLMFLAYIFFTIITGYNLSK